ncbi:hypothetical protein ARALYDRAFT_891363 [Arabidopsis lyrata subsp. lyrata]|uniref:FBD domain-containing protein n=1 Tax=Arabidopsis lyrata subsp. lyrata TaxID=81972 RepID=D7KNP2_ARALL|nr:hypothetical protein ARALYDRAFT_891363 [Arabidopsis lyrata subsp. lyrata]
MVVERSPGDNAGHFIVRMASLEMLRLRIDMENDGGFLIDAPSLELLEIREYLGGFCGIEHSMPKIEAANVYVTCSHTEQILSSLTSIKQLGLCLATSKVIIITSSL